MAPRPSVEDLVERRLWPFVEQVVTDWALPGLALCVVHEGDRALARGFGTRDGSTGRPVTADTPFHLASVSKTVVATAVMQLVEAGEVELDGAITAYLPDLPWADPRAGQITVEHLLSHRSGLGDVTDYGWHEPLRDEGALARHAARVAAWPLRDDPGVACSYSNAGYEVLGHLVAVTSGRSFEGAVKDRVLHPAGMTASTFGPDDLPAGLGARPHLGLPPRVVPGVYPYTRQHAPSSSLHSSAADLGRWMVAHLARGGGLVSPSTHEVMWRPRVPCGGVWHAEMALGWFWGTAVGHRVVNHSGADPGFESNLGLLPEQGLGVAVLADSNTAPMTSLSEAALAVLLGQDLRDPPPPPVTVALAPVLRRYGVAAAADLYRRLAAQDPPAVDLDESAFEDAVWGAVELHRTDLVGPVLRLWEEVSPESSSAAFLTGWAHAVDGRRQQAVRHLRRAVDLDPGNDDAAAMLDDLTAGP